MLTKKSLNRCLFAGVFLALIPAAQGRAQTEAPLTLDEEYAQLAEEVPGFGGLYLDTAGTTHVYLVDLSLAPQVQGLGERVVVQQGDYDFRDLVAWKDAVRPQLAQRGAVYLDIDEQRNRLVFGVERASLDAFNSALPSFLRGARVPSAAVLVEAAEPIVPAELLTDTIRPVPAGVQITNANGGICTLGVNATRQGVRGFVTASHCTAKRSAVEGTVFFQSTIGAFREVGTETADPPFFLGGSCPFGRECRLSDAAFVSYFSSSLSAGGKIANPPCSFGVGSLTVNPQTPRLPITSFIFGSPVSGSIVSKTGTATGCTFGITLNTCVDTNVAGTVITLLCQNRVAGTATLPGDSGSPVFLHGGDHATLAGILWGRGSGTYFYSPWILVVSELGGVIPDAP